MLKIRLDIGRDNLVSRLFTRELEKNGIKVYWITTGKDTIIVEDYDPKDENRIEEIIRGMIK